MFLLLQYAFETYCPRTCQSIILDTLLKLAKYYGFVGFSSSKVLILLILFVTTSSENLVSSIIVFLGVFLTALCISDLPLDFLQ